MRWEGIEWTGGPVMSVLWAGHLLGKPRVTGSQVGAERAQS